MRNCKEPSNWQYTLLTPTHIKLGLKDEGSHATIMQLDFCQLLEADVMQWVRSPTGLGLLNDGGRCAKFSVILNKLHSDGYSHNTPVEALCTTAKAVVPDRISLPDNAGGCNPAK